MEEGAARFSPRLLFSLFRGFPPFYARPCGQLALTSGFARKFMSGWSAVAPSLSILLPPIYNFSAHLRQLSDARERAPALQPGDSILRRVVYHRRDRKNCRLGVERRDLLSGKSLAVAVTVAVAIVKAKAQRIFNDGNI